ARLAESIVVRDPPPVNVAVVSEHDHPDVAGVVAIFGRAGATCAITRAARGATLSNASETIELPAGPAREVDPTGAGGGGGVCRPLELARGALLADAGRAAAWAAARVVEGAGVGTLPQSPL